MAEKMSLKERLALKMDEMAEQNAAQVRLKYYDRWMKICGVDRWEDIDFDNPIVHLEWFLCDWRMLGKLTDGNRDEVLALMDEQQR